MSAPRGAPRRVLLIQLRRFGDVVLSTALLENLKQELPDTRVDFLVGAPAAPLLAQQPFVDDLIVYDQEHPLRSWRDVRARRYDWIIDVQSSPRTAPLTRVSGAKLRIGWDVRGWGWVYNRRLPRSGRPPEYVVRERQRLLELAGVPARDVKPRLALTSDERAGGEQDAIAFGAPAGVPRVGMLLSAGERSKYWRVQGFADVSNALTEEGVSPLVFNTPGDDALVRELVRAAPRTIVVPPLDIRRFIGVLSACAVFVSGDTGPVHMATALDVPTVTIFGPTNPLWWSPRLPTTAVVRDESVLCLGCQYADCPIGHDCMVGVTGAMVMAEVRRLLRR